MPWIYFDRDELPAPSLKLPTLDGDNLEPSDFRGISALVLCFTHSLECSACSSLIRELNGAAGVLRGQGADALEVIPNGAPYPSPDLNRRRILVDRDDALRRAYASIFEFDVSGQVMLFILNQFGVPFRAWTGDEPDGEIIPQMLKFLESAALLCPE